MMFNTLPNFQKQCIALDRQKIASKDVRKLNLVFTRSNAQNHSMVRICPSYHALSLTLAMRTLQFLVFDHLSF